MFNVWWEILLGICWKFNGKNLRERISKISEALVNSLLMVQFFLWDTAYMSIVCNVM